VVTRRSTDAGGVAARRAVVRWARRLFRREWRSQGLITVLLSLTVAAAVGGATAAYNTAEASDDADLGRARYALRFTAEDQEALQANLARAEDWFDGAEVIPRWSRPIPGSVEEVEYRAQDPAAALGAPMLALADGRYPHAADEVAVTDGVAEIFELEIGSTFDLDDVERRVVGVVENPNDLDADFALAAPSDDEPADAATILVPGGSEAPESFMASEGLDAASDVELLERETGAGLLVAVSVLGIAQVVLMLVALVAAAAFVVIAERRLRQLGMLAAIGATEKHLRLVTIANGAVVGVVAAAVGGTVGLAGWMAAASPMEGPVGHRIDPLNVPWALVAVCLLVVVVTAVAASWWPARVVARVPVTRALSGRRPSAERHARRTLGLAALFVAVGLGCLVAGKRSDALLVAAGTVATVTGVLLLSPLAIRALGVVARTMPVGVRLALRDLARHQTRSAMALAAISLALGIPAAIVIAAEATAQEQSGQGNLAEDQLLVRTGLPDEPLDLPETGSDVEELEEHVDQVAAALGRPDVMPLDVVRDPSSQPLESGERMAVTLGIKVDPGEVPDAGGLGPTPQVPETWTNVGLLYVATDELLAPHGVTLADVDPQVEILAVETRDLWVLGIADPRGELELSSMNVERIDPGYTSLPTAFITPEGVRRYDLEPLRAGWLLTASAPLTGEQIAAARSVAADSGLVVEVREDDVGGLVAMRTRATAVGAAVALGVLAMTVGLMRTEAAGDLRTLTATGATSRIRRTLTAATAAGLAVLGTLGAYLGVGAGYLGRLGALGHVPIGHLGVLAVGVPTAAIVAGWLLAGREPANLARPLTE
jgi:putative ABC transport system permease protein